MNSRRVTRREWAMLLAAAPVAAQVTSKTPPQGTPAPPPAGATPEQKRQKAFDDIRKTSERLSQMEVPMNIEPAFAFRP